MSILAKVLSILGVVALMYATRSVRLVAFDAHQRGEQYEDVYYLPPAEWLPTLSLGYTTALADLLWCRALVYFGEELGHRGAVKNVFNYTDAMIALDPDFQAPYRWAATASSYRPVPPTRAETERAASYLRRAVKRWPNDGEMRWDAGSFLRFELMPVVKEPDLRLKIEEEAAAHLHVASVKGAGPAWLALNNSTLLTKLGKKELAIRQLEEVYATVDDPSTRTSIAIRLAQLRSETETEALRVAVEQFEQQRLASFPYASRDLFFIIGPKVSAAYEDAIATRFAPPVGAEEEGLAEQEDEDLVP